MKIIAILSQKGGAGKTTLAINLSVVASKLRKQSVIIDLDPQASACSWHDDRDLELPVVVSAQASRLQNVIDAAKEEGADFVFIDTSPNSESASLTAARLADYILIPCRPAIMDLRSIKNTIDLVNLAHKKAAAVVLTCVPPRGTLAQQAAVAVSSYEIELCPFQIGQRMDYVHSITAGQGVSEYNKNGKASQEIDALYKWLVRKMK